MKPGLAKILALAAVTGSAMAQPASSGRADPAAFAAPAPGQQFSDADRAAFLDARIAALHAGLKFSPEQEKLWPPVENALRTAGRSAMERYQKFISAPAGETLIDRLRQRGESAVTRGQNLQEFAGAATPLYASLSDEQKHRLPVLMRALRPHFLHHHLAMMGKPWEHWRHGWGGEGGMEPEGRALPGVELR